ncbi:MAG: hypothetical protein ACO3IB_10305 [Phycisphaerales bacterium]
MRHLVAAFAGAVVLFLWGFLAYAVLDVWKFAYPSTNSDATILESLDTGLSTDGAYFLPSMPDTFMTETTDPEALAANKAFEERLGKGPVALVLFRKQGMEPMAASELIRGFIIEFGAALLLTCLMSASKGGTGGRIFFGSTIALFAALATWGVAGNFFHLPLAFMYANMADVVIGGTFCATAIALVLGRGRAKDALPSAA